MGVKAFGVYCSPPKKCTIAQGFENGFTLQWTAARRLPIVYESFRYAKLALAEMEAPTRKELH